MLAPRRSRLSKEYPGTGTLKPLCHCQRIQWKEVDMNGLIYLIGLIVVIMAILSFFGLR